VARRPDDLRGHLRGAGPAVSWPVRGPRPVRASAAFAPKTRLPGNWGTRAPDQQQAVTLGGFFGTRHPWGHRWRLPGPRRRYDVAMNDDRRTAVQGGAAPREWFRRSVRGDHAPGTATTVIATAAVLMTGTGSAVVTGRRLPRCRQRSTRCTPIRAGFS
jgi:hypothetical protein